MIPLVVLLTLPAVVDNGWAEQLTTTEPISGQTKHMFVELVQDNYATRNSINWFLIDAKKQAKSNF